MLSTWDLLSGFTLFSMIFVYHARRAHTNYMIFLATHFILTFFIGSYWLLLIYGWPTATSRGNENALPMCLITFGPALLQLIWLSLLGKTIKHNPHILQQYRNFLARNAFIATERRHFQILLNRAAGRRERKARNKARLYKILAYTILICFLVICITELLWILGGIAFGFVFFQSTRVSGC